MGVINSKNIKGVKGDENNNGFTNPEEENNAAAPEEALSEDDVAMKEINKWKPFMKDLVSLPDIANKIKDVELAEKIKIDNKKGIIVDSENVKKFITGDKDFLPDVMLYFSEVGLKDPENTEITEKEFKFDKEKAEMISTPGDTKNLKKEATKEQIKPIYDSIINATRVAKKHAVFRRIIKDYITDSDKFKDAMKQENISGSKDAIIAGEENASEKGLEDIKKKEVNEENKEGGDNLSIGDDTQSVSSRGSTISNTSTISGGSTISNTSINSNTSTNSNYSGGVRIYGLRTAEELQENKRKADYKQFKKEARGNFEQKMYSFLADNEAMATFMDEPTNQANLLTMVYYGKIPKKWINKEATSQKQAVAEALVTAINKYTPKEAAAPVTDAPEQGAEGQATDAAEGAAAEGAEVPATDAAEVPVTPDAAPAAAKPSGGTSGGNNTSITTSAGDQAIQLAAMIKNTILETAGLQNPTTSASSNPIEKAIEILPNTFAEHNPSVPQTGGGTTSGENEIKKRKKKRGKKPKHINISINVGNKNMIIDETSSSSSDSDSSSSHDDTTSTSSSSSDDEDKHKQHKNKRSKNKKGKYVVNNK